MTAAALLLLLAAAGAAQPQFPPKPPEGAIGAAEPEVAKSTSAAPPSSPPPVLGGGDVRMLDDAPPPPKKKKKKRNPDDEPFSIPSNPLRVKIHKAAAAWEPISVKAGGSAAAAKSAASWKLVRKGKKISGGQKSKAKAVARLYPSGEDKKLVVAIFPEALAKHRIHIEVRFQVIEGFLERVQVAAVTAEPGGEPLDDANMLRLRGVPFQEERPASGAVTLSGMDIKPGKRTFNGGALKLAEFSHTELNPRSLGLTSVEWLAKGLTEPKP